MYGVDIREDRLALDLTEEVQRIGWVYQWEALRGILARELRTHGGQRVVADTAGVGRTVIRKFLELKTYPEPENRRRLFDWAADRPIVVPALESVCIATLVEELPNTHARAARREIANLLLRLHTEASGIVPAWLQEELAGRSIPLTSED